MTIYIIYILMQCINFSYSQEIYNEIASRRVLKMEETFNLMSNMEQYVGVGHQKDIVLVLGETGSGKSTFTQFIANATSKLESIDVAHGLEEYVIWDHGNKIGTGFKRKTLFPEKVIDRDTNIAYYDCPSFENHENATIDITSTYLINRILKDARSAKLVLIVPHSAVNVDERLEFMQFLKHFLQFTKDVKKYKDAIILVVTKVKNQITDNFLKDKNFIENIAFFLKETKDFFEKQNELKRTHFNEQSIQLIDIFLKKVDNNYKNIEILRRPNKGGDIFDMDIFLKEKGRIRTKIHDTIKFVDISDDDFNYTLAGSTKIQISKLMNKFNHDIANDISDTVSDILKYFDNKMKKCTDIYEIKQEITSMNKYVLKIYHDIEKVTKFKDFVVTYIEFLNDLRIHSARNLFLNFLEKKKIIDFLDKISGNKIHERPILWIRRFEEVLNRLSEIKSWYYFITQLYKNLSTYLIYHPVPNDLKPPNLDVLFNISNIYDSEVSQDVRKLMRHKRFKDELDSFLDTMLDNSVLDNRKYSLNGTCVILGTYFKMSNIYEHCLKNSSRIEIFALSSALVDIEHFKKSILIMAPELNNVTSSYTGNITHISTESIKMTNNSLANVSHQLVNYKTYLLSHLDDKFRRRDLLNFYFKLGNYSQILEEYDPFLFVNELQQLEEKPHSYLKNNELYKCYWSMLERIRMFQEKKQKDGDGKTLLSYLYMASLSKALRVKNDVEEELIVDIRSYFNIIVDNIKKLKDFNTEVIKQECHLKYVKQIDEKISEAQELINTDIKTAIDNYMKDLENKFKKLLDEITGLKKKAFENLKLLEKRKKDLETLFIFHTVMSVFKLALPLLSFIPVVGQVLNVVAPVVVGTVEHGVNTFFKPQEASMTILPGVINNIDSILNEHLSLKIDRTKESIQSISGNIQKHPGKYGNLSKTLKSIQRNISTEANNMFHLTKIMAINKKLRDAVAIYESNNTVSSGRKLNLGSAAQPAATGISTGFGEWKGVKEAEEAISKQKANIEKINHLYEQIEKKIFPLLKRMSDDLKQFQKDSANKTRVGLVVSNWNLQSSLKDIQRMFSQLTEGFQVRDELLCIFQKLVNGINILIQMFDTIQKKEEQKELSDTIATMSLKGDGTYKTSNDTINKAISRLEITTKLNLILSQFQRAIANFKQFVFPFAHLFMDELNIPTELELNRNVDNVVQRIERSIDILKSKTKERDSVIKSEYDPFIFEDYFGSGADYKGPFAVWGNNEYSVTISKFLSGKKIVIKSDIVDSPLDKNAIKFNKIHLVLRSKNLKLNEIINEKLQYFDIMMKHHGDSYYRCDNHFYLLFSDSMEFYFSFAKKQSGKPIRVNNVYTKVLKYDFILSPYATWSLQLNTVGNSSFHDLDFLRDQIDLELSGDGQYVSTDLKFCDERVNDYYTPIHEISVTDIGGLKKW